MSHGGFVFWYHFFGAILILNRTRLVTKEGGGKNVTTVLCNDLTVKFFLSIEYT